MNDFLDSIQSYWVSGGILLFPLALASMGIWGFFLRSRERMKQLVREGKQLQDEVAQHDLSTLPCKGRLSHWLRRIAEDIKSGLHPRVAFRRRKDECMEELRRDIVILCALTAVAPLLGLLGTVRGMIDTFGAVSQVSGNTGVEVASGISQALITTQFGLVIAVPGVFGITRIRALSQEFEALLGTLSATALARIESPELYERT